MKGVKNIIKLIKEENNIRSISAFLIGILLTTLFYSYFYNNKMKIDLSLHDEARVKKQLLK